MKLVQSVVDGVRTHDLVGHVCTQHDVVLVLQYGGYEPGPQVQPGVGGGGREGREEGETVRGRREGEWKGIRDNVRQDQATKSIVL